MNCIFKTYFLMLAHYNQWANHVLVGDILWFERIKGVIASTYTLDEILYNQLAQLENA